MQEALANAPAAFEALEKYLTENDEQKDAAAEAFSNLYEKEGGKALTKDDLEALDGITDDPLSKESQSMEMWTALSEE
jgi:hypothetical protein